MWTPYEDVYSSLASSSILRVFTGLGSWVMAPDHHAQPPDRNSPFPIPNLAFGEDASKL